MKKSVKRLLIAFAAILAIALLCVALYIIGYLDVFIIFVLIPGIILASIACFVVSLVSVIRLQRKNEPIPSEKKTMLAISSVFLLCVLMSVVTLVAVFAMAIAFM
jgi:hypothetical protein